MVDISEGKILHLIKNIMPQIFGIACRGNGAQLSGFHSEKQRDQGQRYQQQSHFNRIGQISACDAHIDNIGHQKRNQHFHKHLQSHKYGSQKRLPLVLPDGAK